MSELKRPERYVQFESIKPELKEITEFYTQKVTDYQYRLKQLNEYADELENEILVLKDTPKVEVLLDDMAKPLVVVPQFVSDWFDINQDDINGNINALTRNIYRKLKIEWSEMDKWFMYSPNKPIETLISMKLDGYTVEKEKMYILKHIDLSEQYKNESVYLSRSRYAKLKHESFLKDDDMSKTKQCHFTQSEIDKLNIGSYEQIEVNP